MEGNNSTEPVNDTSVQGEQGGEQVAGQETLTESGTQAVEQGDTTSKDDKRNPSKERKDSREKERRDSRERESRKERDRKERRDSRERDRDRDRDRRDRDRDRRDRKSKRSKSRRRSKSRDNKRSKSRDRRRKGSRSRSRSPEKEKKKKVSSWDQGPEGLPASPMTGLSMLGMPAVRHVAPPDPKKARTVYVGGVTAEMTEKVLRDFFEHQIPQVPGRPPSQGNIIDNVQMNPEKMYAFVEFFNFVDADIAMCFDGNKLGAGQIRIRRPTNYIAPPGQKTWAISGALSTQVPDGPNKLFLGNLPATMTDVEVQMLASAFGELQAFTLISEKNGLSKGYAFMCYKNPASTAAACEGLNGCDIGGKRLVCKPANQGAALDLTAVLPQMAAPMGLLGGPAALMGGGAPGLLGAGGVPPMMGGGVPAMMVGAAMGLPLGQLPVGQLPPQATPLLLMDNMVAPEELEDAEEYEEILADVEQECGKLGNLVKVIIPRIQDVIMDNSRLTAADVGKIFVKFNDVESAVRARATLHGRKFNDRTIVMTFLSPEFWNQRGLP